MISRKNAARITTGKKKFLLINPFGIGDVLFTTPVIKALKEAYPGSFIGYWSNLRVKPLLENNPLINRVFALSRGDLKKIFKESFFSGAWRTLLLARQIKKEHFDICLDFSLDHRYSLFTKIFGIKKRIGFNYKGRGRFLSHKVDIDGYSGRHAVEYYLDLLRFLDVKAEDRALDLAPSADAERKSRDILFRNGIKDKDLVIGIAPGGGGSWGKDAVYKHWPALKFAQLGQRLVDEFRAKVVLVGDESERPLADIIVSAMRNKPLDLVGKTDLDILAGLIKKFSLFISNDGGPMHMAVALGVKTVSVFGPVNEAVYGPYPEARNHVVIKWDSSCRPCYSNFKLPACDRNRECLRSIGVDEVFEAARILLS